MTLGMIGEAVGCYVLVSYPDREIYQKDIEE